MADHVFAWLQPRLLHPEPLTTLTCDKEATAGDQEQAADKVEPVWSAYNAGETAGRAPARSIDENKLDLLRLEYEAFLAQRPLAERIARGGGRAGGGLRPVHALRRVHALPAARAAGQPGPADRHARCWPWRTVALARWAVRRSLAGGAGAR